MSLDGRGWTSIACGPVGWIETGEGWLVGRPRWAPDGVDLSRPSPARVYDVHLGGSHNVAADREAASQVTRFMPELPLILRANRSFLGRAVRFLVDAGVTQFLDLGSGIPTVGNVHEIAQRADPNCRVVYVDIDPVAVAHGRHILADNANAAAIEGDLRQPNQILAAAEVRALLDFTRPLAVLMVAVLQFVDDSDDPAGIVAQYRDAVVSGSYLAVSHASWEGLPGRAEEATEAYARRVSDFWLRSRAQVTGFFDGWRLVGPGVVYLTEWRPDAGETGGYRPEWTSTFCGVACKP
jgi:SAM-dependent methyltransferase